MKPETKNWLALAKEDYISADILLENRRYPYAIYYYCQAIEKVLKAIIIQRSDDPPPKSHDFAYLVKLGRLSLNEKHVDSIEELNKHYKRVRYRDISQAHYNTKVKTKPITNLAKSVYAWIHQLLKTI